MTDAEYVIAPLKGRNPVLTQIVKERFEAIAGTVNPKNTVALRQAGNYCVIPIARSMPRVVTAAVKSNIIEILKKEPWNY